MMTMTRLQEERLIVDEETLAYTLLTYYAMCFTLNLYKHSRTLWSASLIVSAGEGIMFEILVLNVLMVGSIHLPAGFLVIVSDLGPEYREFKPWPVHLHGVPRQNT